MAGSRARLFIENFLIYGLAGVLGKAIPFVLLPLITRLITDPAVFGKLELYRLMVSFGTPIAVVGMYDSMFRFYFDEDSNENRKSVCSSSLTIVFISGFLVVFSGLLTTPILARFVFRDSGSEILIFVALAVIFFSALKSIVAAPTRMQNNRKVYMVMHLLVPVTSYAVSIPVIVMGMPLGGLVAGSAFSVLFSLTVFWYLNRSWFEWRLVDKTRIRELLRFGLPLAPTFFIYWIFNACDRLMISHMLGQDLLGIYGIGARVAGISSLIYMAFSGGWQYFAFSTMKDADHVDLMSRTFEILGVLTFVSTLMYFPFVRLFYPILVGGSYQAGVSVTPFLFLAPLVLMLSQILATQMQVIKKPGLSTCVRILSAFLNVTLNYYLIPTWGIEGAAVATLVSYILMTVVLYLLTLRFELFNISIRFKIITVFFCLLFVILSAYLWDKVLLQFLLSTLFAFCIIWVYRSTIRQIISRFFVKVGDAYAGNK